MTNTLGCAQTNRGNHIRFRHRGRGGRMSGRTRCGLDWRNRVCRDRRACYRGSSCRFDMHHAVFLRMSQWNRRAPSDRTRRAIDVDDHGIRSQPKLLRRSSGRPRDQRSRTKIFDERHEPRQIGVDVIECNGRRLRQFAQLLIGRCGIEIRRIEILWQYRFAPFRVIPRRGPFSDIVRASGPMRCDGSEADRRDQMGRVLNDKPTGEDIRDARTRLRVDSRTDGNSEWIPRGWSPGCSVPAQRHAHKGVGIGTGSIGQPRAIARDEHGFVDCSEGQTNGQRWNGNALRRISVADEQYIDIALDRDEIRGNSDALRFTMPGSVRH